MEVQKKWGAPWHILDLILHEDERGFLFEILRFKDFEIPGEGQLYTFSVAPHQRRGDHYHLIKHEWFTCVFGEVEILMTSNNGEDKIVKLSQRNPQIVYAAPGTTHALVNKKDTTAIVVSYGSKQHDPDNEDTYRKIACSSQHV